MDHEPKPKPSHGSGKKKQAKGATSTTKKSTGKSMAKAFKPMDTPLFCKKSLQTIQEEHEYLDPCGMEATNDIIDHLVGEQVTKNGKLLQCTLPMTNAMGTLLRK